MKLRKYMLIFVAVLFVYIFPIRVHAFGGFVCPKGSNIYHNIYCYFVEGYNLDELFWFDTAQQAGAAGLKPCSECNSEEGFAFHYDLETNWKTNNHLIQSAMEIEAERAYDKGREVGYEEGYGESQHHLDDIEYEAMREGYNEGYYEGYNVGYEEALKKIEDERRENSEATSVLFVIIILVIGIIWLISKLKEKK